VAHRGFVQSGFNDIPHHAARHIQSRDLVEPSSIPLIVNGQTVRS